jgi:hypothetical protein
MWITLDGHVLNFTRNELKRIGISFLSLIDAPSFRTAHITALTALSVNGGCECYLFL